MLSACSTNAGKPNITSYGNGRYGLEVRSYDVASETRKEWYTEADKLCNGKYDVVEPYKTREDSMTGMMYIATGVIKCK